MTYLPIRLPVGVSLLVKKGDSVTKDQILAQTPKDIVPPHEISLVNLLHVSARTAGKYLLKQPGDSVAVGDTIARKSGFMGLSHTEIKSHIDGVVDRYDRGAGILVIKKLEDGDGKMYEIKAPIEGVIDSISEKELILKTEKDVLMGIKGTGISVQAETLVLDEKEGGDGFYVIDIKAIDKIVLLAHVSKDTVMKARGIGAKGIVTKEITDADFSYVQEREQDFPLVQVEESVYANLVKAKNHSLFLSGKEKILIA